MGRILIAGEHGNGIVDEVAPIQARRPATTVAQPASRCLHVAMLLGLAWGRRCTILDGRQRSNSCCE